MSAAPDLLRRHRALKKTLARYRGKPFAWGKADCVTMLRSHLVAMGHKRLPKQPRYATALGAKKVLKGLGFDTVAELLDSLLPRIPPARVNAGDIVLMSGTDGLDSVTVSVGGDKVAGWHEDGDGMVVIVPKSIEGAWRA